MCCSVVSLLEDATRTYICSVLQCVAVCCNVLQCVAECCSVLQCGAAWCHCWKTWLAPIYVVCCSVLQCVAVCRSVLQCVAVWCSLVSQLEVMSRFQILIHFSVYTLQHTARHCNTLRIHFSVHTHTCSISDTSAVFFLRASCSSTSLSCNNCNMSSARCRSFCCSETLRAKFWQSSSRSLRRSCVRDKSDRRVSDSRIRASSVSMRLCMCHDSFHLCDVTHQGRDSMARVRSMHSGAAVYVP